LKAIVMAGGEGSRLRPVTSVRPKPLAPVANKPVMHHIVDLLRRHGITDVIATLHYLADEVETYFGDGSEFGVKMRYVVEDSPLGTAGAVKLAQELIGDERFLIISGDALTDMDLTALVKFHDENASAATIALQRVQNPLEFGVVVTDEQHRVTRFLEKPSWGEIFSDTINTGIYVLEPEILNYMERGKSYDFSRDLFPRMLHESKPLFGRITTEYWTDIGNLQQYQQANYDALRGLVKVEIDGVETSPGVWIDETARVHPEARIYGPVVIGCNATIERGAVVAELSVVGASSIIAQNAHIHRSITWEDVYVGEGCSLTGCTVLDRNILKERVTVQEGAVIGRGCTIGGGSVVNGNVKLWPDKTVASGSVVSMSLIYGIKWPGSLFGADGVSGLANIEMTPEFALKLGQAFGSALKHGQTVLTSRDSHPATRITNRCIISGLLSVGVNVLDLRAYPLPASRYAIRAAGDGGVHVRVSPKDPSQFLVEFFDASGINIDKTRERKVENLFFREDFRRTSMDVVGQLDFPSRLLEGYIGDFEQTLDAGRLRDANFRVVIDYAFGNASLILPRILGKLGVEMVSLNAYFDDAQARAVTTDRAKHLEQLSNVTLSLKANLGILLDHDGETLTLVDDRGRVIEDSMLFGVLALLVAKATPGARIAVPVTMPSAIETITRENGAEIIRARSDRRAVMALAEQEGRALSLAAGGNFEILFPEFGPAFDALYAAAKVLTLLANERVALSSYVDRIPASHLARRSVRCPWEHKGQIMRKLLDETNGRHVELTDGIRVERDGGWVLVLPDASDPTVNVYAEGASDADARAFVEQVARRVDELVRA